MHFREAPDVLVCAGVWKILHAHARRSTQARVKPLDRQPAPISATDVWRAGLGLSTREMIEVRPCPRMRPVAAPPTEIGPCGLDGGASFLAGFGSA